MEICLDLIILAVSSWSKIMQEGFIVEWIERGIPDAIDTPVNGVVGNLDTDRSL